MARFVEAQQAPTLPMRPKLSVAGPDAHDFNSCTILKDETAADDFWPWLREQLIARPEYVAKMAGILELANPRHLPLPKSLIKLDALVDVYR